MNEHFTYDEDLALVKLAKFERNAFDQLFCKYSPYIFKIAYDVSNDKHLADDVVQQTFYRAMLGAIKADWETSQSFKAWLATIARNVLWDEIKKLKKSKRTNLLSTFVNFEVEDTINIEPEAAFLIKEQHQLIAKIISSLPKHQKEAIYLRFYLGCKITEIAEITGRNRSTVDSDIKRAKDFIKIKLSAMQNDVLLQKNSTESLDFSKLSQSSLLDANISGADTSPMHD